MRFVFVILFVIIITNKLFLFNEEFLILLSFMSFCFVVYKQLGEKINLHFETKTLNIKHSLVISINLISEKLNEMKKLNEKILNLQKNFNSLKKYYLTFSRKFLTQFIIYLNNIEKLNFSNKLVCLTKIKEEYFKLIVLLLIKKMQIINLLIQFYGNNLKIKRFQTLNFINKLILIKKI
uniref:ATP synthase F1 subunit 4 n=1 Tax=Deltalsia parasitica TaxID=1424640 RepID=UPI0022FD392A|nr:ATP synthase F1 subunit 4 [Deltalsia parasitica]WAX04276.1 ATP synthase F1 subunit 4 [Deltalsia parasitica]